MTDDNDNTVIEISDVKRSDGQQEFLVAVNESGEEENGGTIWWNGTSHREAWEVARELAEDFGGRIVDETLRNLTPMGVA
jgi:hypothetical protein